MLNANLSEFNNETTEEDQTNDVTSYMMHKLGKYSLNTY